jgi:hypothetical protein
LRRFDGGTIFPSACRREILAVYGKKGKRVSIQSRGWNSVEMLANSKAGKIESPS